VPSGKESSLRVRVGARGVRTLQLLPFPLMHPVLGWGPVSEQAGAGGTSAAPVVGAEGDWLCYRPLKATAKLSQNKYKRFSALCFDCVISHLALDSLEDGLRAGGSPSPARRAGGSGAVRARSVGSAVQHQAPGSGEGLCLGLRELLGCFSGRGPRWAGESGAPRACHGLPGAPRRHQWVPGSSGASAAIRYLINVLNNVMFR